MFYFVHIQWYVCAVHKFTIWRVSCSHSIRFKCTTYTYELVKKLYTTTKHSVVLLYYVVIILLNSQSFRDTSVRNARFLLLSYSRNTHQRRTDFALFFDRKSCRLAAVHIAIIARWKLKRLIFLFTCSMRSIDVVSSLRPLSLSLRFYTVSFHYICTRLYERIHFVKLYASTRRTFL